LHSQLFLFNALAFPYIPFKSLKIRLVVFSIPTAPTNHPFSLEQLSDLSRRQKAATSSGHAFSVVIRVRDFVRKLDGLGLSRRELEFEVQLGSAALG
jgi:hypothetical protein